jgi:DNA-binding NtrC family response regulator
MRVETYAKSSEALARFFCDPDGFDLVITALSMSKLTGTQLAKEMTTVRPDLPVLLCTGNPQLLTSDQLREAGISLVLAKPFQVQGLINALRQLGIGQAGSTAR